VTGGNNGGGSLTSISTKSTHVFQNLASIEISDTKINNNGGGGCCRNYDTYYFHPSMLLGEKLTGDMMLLHIYMLDWWQPGPELTGNSNFTMNEAVKINFNYGL
jgi:hypothetical protein